MIGGLSGEVMVRVDIDGDSARKAGEWKPGAAIREIQQGPRGELYILTDARSGGKLMRLEPAR